MTIADRASLNILVVNHAYLSLSYKTRGSIYENNYKYCTIYEMIFLNGFLI